MLTRNSCGEEQGCLCQGNNGGPTGVRGSPREAPAHPLPSPTLIPASPEEEVLWKHQPWETGLVPAPASGGAKGQKDATGIHLLSRSRKKQPIPGIMAVFNGVH